MHCRPQVLPHTIPIPIQKLTDLEKEKLHDFSGCAVCFYFFPRDFSLEGIEPHIVCTP